MNLFIPNILHLLTSNGLLLVPLFLLMAIEEMCIPLSGEAILLIAAISAGTTHNLSLFLLLMVVCIAGSTLGSSISFWMGRVGGFPLLYRYGHLVRLKESKLKVGMYLFQRYGQWVALFGRCVPLVRAYVPLIAGTYQMKWLTFILANLLGTCITLSLYGGAPYLLGHAMQGFVGIVGIVGMAAVVIVLVLFLLLFRRYQRQWELKAEQLFPGSLKDHHSRSRRDTPLEIEDMNTRTMMMRATLLK